MRLKHAVRSIPQRKNKDVAHDVGVGVGFWETRDNILFGS